MQGNTKAEKDFRCIPNEDKWHHNIQTPRLFSRIAKSRETTVTVTDIATTTNKPTGP